MQMRNRLVGVAALAAAFFGAQAASAAGGGIHIKGGGGVSGGSGGASAGAEGETAEHPEPKRTDESATEGGPKEGEAKEGEEESGISLGLDMVVGFGKTNIVNEDITAGPNGVGPVDSISGSQLNVESFIFRGGFEPVRHFGLGARLPLSLGNFNPPGRESRGTSSLGNIELGAEYEAELSDQVTLIPDLGFALPTGQGDEVPDSIDKLQFVTAGRIDQNAYDRFAINKAAAAARGWEDNALFEPKRFGIIPKVTLEYKNPNGLRIVPYLKLENLIDTTGNADTKYIGELVGALRIAYLASKQVEPGVRIWGNIPLAAPSGVTAVAVVEPELRLHFGVATPYLGIVLPFAGPIAKDPSQFIGIRVGVAAQF